MYGSLKQIQNRSFKHGQYALSALASGIVLGSLICPALVYASENSGGTAVDVIGARRRPYAGVYSTTAGRRVRKGPMGPASGPAPKGVKVKNYHPSGKSK